MLDAREESERLEALQRYYILDTPPDPAFDRITDLAAALFAAPIALVSLVDERRQWFKSCVGLSVRETSRDVAFCAHAIQREEPLVVPDARSDPRFRDNPLVTGPPHIRFYAGAPLVTPGAHKLGTLCIIDTERRALDEKDLRRLCALAKTVVDLLELHARTGELAAARNEMVTILDSMDELVVARDLANRPLIVNDAARRVFGAANRTSDAARWVAETQVLRSDLSPLPPDQLPIVRAMAGEIVRGEVIGTRTETGPARFFSVNATPLRDPSHRIVGGVAVARDVTEERRLQELERRHARTDPLTGLGNRRALDEIARHVLAHADRRNEPTSVALFDLDHFKRINDQGGHEAGDAVLREVSAVLRRNSRASDVPIRWGGEELLVLLPDCDLEGARVFAERVRGEVERVATACTGRVTISAGVAVREREEDLAAVIARADARLYEAKRGGRNRVA